MRRSNELIGAASGSPSLQWFTFCKASRKQISASSKFEYCMTWRPSGSENRASPGRSQPNGPRIRLELSHLPLELDLYM